MTERPGDFSHIPLPLVLSGIPIIPGGGSPTERTTQNLNNREGHGAYINRRSAEMSRFWKERHNERVENNLPEIFGGIPLLLEIDPEVDIEFLRGLGFEIVSELEEGFIIVATDDADFTTLNEKVTNFIANANRSGSPAKIYGLREEHDRLRHILTEELFGQWHLIQDDIMYTVDVGVECTGNIILPPYPRKVANESIEHFNLKVSRWQQNYIDSFRGIVNKINEVIGCENSSEIENITNFDGKMLIIIDDYETFSNEEKNQIEDFIKNLDINHHKVLITTRANLIIGEEIPINEFTKTETKEFFKKIYETKFKDNKSNLNDFILSEKYVDKLHTITSGRPIFIFQFAYVSLQRGIREALETNFASNKDAKEFLYGRIYDYLPQGAKDIFVIISQLIADEHESNLIEKIRYILNVENEKEEFDKSIQELIKIKIIEVYESKFFRVYSKELLEIMLSFYNTRDNNFKSGVNSRLLQISRDKKLNNDLALLKNADSSRYSKNEAEVTSLYRQIINRNHAPKQIKLQALLNLSSYLVTDKGKTDDAIKMLEDYLYLFNDEPEIIKMYSMYTWSRGQHEKAIDILQNYFSQPHNSFIKSDIHLELFGLLLTNKSIFWLSEREETKNNYKNGNIDADQYAEQMIKQKEAFLDIFKKQGHVLFNYVRNNDISNIKSGARQNMQTGLYQLIEICIRIKKYDYANVVATYGMNTFPIHYKKNLAAKLDRITQYKNDDQTLNYLKDVRF